MAESALKHGKPVLEVCCPSTIKATFGHMTRVLADAVERAKARAEKAGAAADLVVLFSEAAMLYK